MTVAQADLRELERERRRLERARDPQALEELAGRAEQLPPSAKRDRLVYAARQNAAWARRSTVTGPWLERGPLIGILALLAVLLGGCAAVVSAGGLDDSFAAYTFHNDRNETVEIWACANAGCTERDLRGTVAPGNDLVEYDAVDGDDVLVASAGDGRVLGCFTLPSVDFGESPALDLGDAEECPPETPASVR